MPEHAFLIDREDGAIHVLLLPPIPVIIFDLLFSMEELVGQAVHNLIRPHQSLFYIDHQSFLLFVEVDRAGDIHRSLGSQA